MELDRVRLKVALAERQLTQGKLAQRLNIAPSTLSGWVNGLATPPTNWIRRVEQALGLPGGALRPTISKPADNG
jgi:transcriptional regulator with XRE-family HTH domain